MEMLELLRGLVQIESPTGDTQELCERVIRELEELGFTAARDGEAIRAHPPGEGAAAALVVEPPDGDGHLKTARKGIGRFRFRVTGRPAHSSTPDRGASAVYELALLVLRLHGLAEPEHGVTVNVGVVGGG